MKQIFLFLFLLINATAYSQVSSKLKLRQLEQGTPGQIIVVDSLGNATYGNGGGIYEGGGTIPNGTYAQATAGANPEFVIGDFPDWPILNQNEDERGIFYSPDWLGYIGMIYGNGTGFSYIANTPTTAELFVDATGGGGFGWNVGSS